MRGGKSHPLPHAPAQLRGKLRQGDKLQVILEACGGVEQRLPRCEGCPDQEIFLSLADLLHKLAFSN